MKKIYFIVAVAAALIATSCNKEIDFWETENPSVGELSTTATRTRSGMTSVNAVKGNPYSVSSMRQAFAALVSEGVISPNVSIDKVVYPTHYYVRFTPRNVADADSLSFNSGFELYPYPIDNECDCPSNDEYSEDVPVEYEDADYGNLEYYASVPVSSLASTRAGTTSYEILDELCITDEGYSNPGTRGDEDYISDDVLEQLLAKSFELTNNEYEPETRANNDWQPSGRITAYDDIVDGAVAVPGVKVRARRWFTTYKGVTDILGYFKCNGTFKRKANYSIVWEGNGWDIRDNSLIVQAYFNGPKIKGEWNLYIDDKNSKSLRYATIQRAAYRWFRLTYKHNLTPPVTTQKIAYIHNKHPFKDYRQGDYNLDHNLGLIHSIRVFGKDADGWRDLSSVFATTCHEIGHAAHCNNNFNYYVNTDKVLRESWARCVQFYLTNQEYQRLGVYDKYMSIKVLPAEWFDENKTGTVKMITPDRSRNFQLWNSITGDEIYLPILIDLIDDFNQREYFKALEEHGRKTSDIAPYKYYPNDNIHDFPMEMLQNIVFNSKTLYDVKDWLILTYQITSEFRKCGLNIFNINDLFESYGY